MVMVQLIDFSALLNFQQFQSIQTPEHSRNDIEDLQHGTDSWTSDTPCEKGKR